MRARSNWFLPVFLLGTVAIAAGAGCPSKKSPNVAPSTASSETVSVIELSPDPVLIKVGDSKQIKATATLGDGTNKELTEDSGVQWTSDNPGTATVDNKGTVVGVSAGITRVTATYGGANASANVTVSP